MYWHFGLLGIFGSLDLWCFGSLVLWIFGALDLWCFGAFLSKGDSANVSVVQNGEEEPRAQRAVCFFNCFSLSCLFACLLFSFTSLSGYYCFFFTFRDHPQKVILETVENMNAWQSLFLKNSDTGHNLQFLWCFFFKLLSFLVYHNDSKLSLLYWEATNIYFKKILVCLSFS